jgi:hypothetical protein
VAAALAGVPVADLLSIGPRPDGSLAVVVSPGPKHVYTAEQLALARLEVQRARLVLNRTPNAGPGAESAPQPGPHWNLGFVGAGFRGRKRRAARGGPGSRAGRGMIPRSLLRTNPRTQNKPSLFFSPS